MAMTKAPAVVVPSREKLCAALAEGLAMETQRDLQSGDETPHVTTPRDGDRNHTEMAVANMAMLHPLTPFNLLFPFF